MTGGRDKLIELLQSAGLEIAGDWRAEEVLPPRAAWRPIISGEAKPSVAVRGDLPDPVTEINAQWHRLAAGSGIIGEDGVFLIDVAGNWTGCAPRRWTRVKLIEQWDLAGVLGERPGQPEFVTLSMDGDTLLGVTTEEDEVWLIAVDRIGERQEEAAKAATQETPQERRPLGHRCFRGPVLRRSCANCGRRGWRSTRPHPMTCAPACWVCRISSCGAGCRQRSWRQ
jgi:hypothetical protein